MTAKRRDEEGRPVPDARGRNEARQESAFDRWLGRQLHGLYDPVLDEGVPDDIARLVEGFGQRSPPDGADDDPKG